MLVRQIEGSSPAPSGTSVTIKVPETRSAASVDTFHSKLTAFSSAESKNSFRLSDPFLMRALTFLDSKKDEYSSLKGRDMTADDFVQLIKPLLDLEKEQKENPWKIVIDTPNANGKYIADPIVQFCSGPPSYDRFLIGFRKGGEPDVKMNNSCVEGRPSLGAIQSSTGHSLEEVKRFYDEAEVQRIAILGSARVFPHPKDSKLTSNNEWGQVYSKRVESEVNKFFDHMEESGVHFTTVNGGWAGVQEGSMGVPMMSHLWELCINMMMVVAIIL